MFKVLLEECLSCVHKAGTIIEQNWHKPHKIRHKGIIDLVTETDLTVQAELQETLKKIFPEAIFIGEESDTPWQQKINSNWSWVVDPVDGTTNFVHGLPFVAISVALCQQAKPVLGIVFAPILKECFFAMQGAGAFLNDAPIHASALTRLQDAVCATGFPYEIRPELPDILRRLEKVLPATQGLRRYGSAALDLAYVAAGRLDIFYEANLKPWDMAAGWLLVAESGGKISDFGGATYQFGQPLLASNGHLHSDMVSILKI